MAVRLTTKIKCVGFDLYSTLIDTDTYNMTEIMNPVYLIIQKLGYSGLFENFLEIRKKIYWKWRRYREENHIELKSKIWWEEILESLNLEFSDEIINQIIQVSHQKWRSQISLYPDVKELLSTLKKSYTLICISNISDGDLAREDMDFFGISQFFDCIVMSSDLGIRKPSPRIFEYALEKVNVRKSETIFIGDTLYDDIQGAKTAGLRLAIHVKRNRSYFFPDYYIEPDISINKLTEIYSIIKSIR
ncbi:MAG: HAD family hydrolase [Candidatus Helarchaeota archaeon]